MTEGPILIRGDQQAEDHESLTLELIDPVHTLLSTTAVTGLIRDDDDLETPVDFDSPIAANVPGIPVSLAFEAVTSFGDSPVTIEVDWGDGVTSIDQADAVAGIVPVVGRHIFDATGTFRVLVTIEGPGALPMYIERQIIVSSFALLDDPLRGGSILAVGGTAENDRIEFRPVPQESVSAMLNGLTLGAFPISALSRIVVHGLSGDDHISLGPSIAVDAVFNAGDGNDLLLGGDRNDLLLGLDGDDILVGLDGDDTVFGGDIWSPLATLSM